MWTPLRFARSPGTGWIWYVVATDGRQEAYFPIAAFKSLIAQDLANRGPAPPYITDETLARLELARLTPAEIAERERALEVQEQITARDQALADAQAREIQSPQWEDLGIIGPLFRWGKTAGPFGVPRVVYAAAAVGVTLWLLRRPRRPNPRMCRC